MRAAALASCLTLAACSGLSWNTEVANTGAARLSMAESVVPGSTTERGLVTRWGYPTQKVREGGQTEYIYRDMSNLPGWYFPQFGDSHRYVIVTFQYGIATGVRSSDGIDCRATFPPRPPGMVVDNPSTVKLVGTCAPPLTPEEAARKGPIATAWEALTRTPDGKGTAAPPKAADTTPGVVEDSYDPSGKAGRRPKGAADAGRGAASPPAPKAGADCADPVITPADGSGDCAGAG